MKKWEIPLTSIPKDVTIHQYLIEKTDFRDKIHSFKKDSNRLRQSATLHYDVQKLLSNFHNFTKSNELYPSMIEGKRVPRNKASYLSASLTWNPYSTDAPEKNPHASTLGSRNIPVSSYSSTGPWLKRNTYTDSYSFIERTQLSQLMDMGIFLDSFKRTLVRSRVSVILGSRPLENLDYAWHNDESIFLNLRINIPLVTTPFHMVQLLNTNEEADTLNLEEFHLETGYAHAYDTEKLHRPVCKQPTTNDRIHLICGVSPWFDFDVSKQAWISNEFYGEMHPFDIMSSGGVSNFIKD